MTFRSPFPDVVIPDVSVYEYLFGELSDADADRTALIESTGGDGLTYRSLTRRVEAFAGILADRGIAVGDVVAILAPNGVAFAVAFHGILRAGATATTLNVLSTADDIAKQLTDSRTRLVVTVEALRTKAVDGGQGAGLSPANVLVIDDCSPVTDRDPRPAVFDPSSHLAALPYSSGTTGHPKGVMLTHRNLVANVAQIEQFGLRRDDVVAAVLPFSHIYGMSVLLNSALHARAKLVILAVFDLAGFLGSIATHRCTVAFIAPPIAVALAKHPMVNDYDLSSLRTVVSGAAPLDEALGRAVSRRLGCRVVQGYGMSELSPVSHGVPFDGGLESRGVEAPLSSCGWTMPNAVSRIVDQETGADIKIPRSGLSDPGELLFKGPNVMAGYLCNVSATAETIDAEGFLHTGDLARVDAHGCVYIVDRLKELIKYKGYQVPPAELEATLLTHPDIADAAVIGVVEPGTGEEIPKAFVVRRQGTRLTAAQVMDYVASIVAPYKKVRQVEFIAAVPKSAAGKILRRELRQLSSSPERSGGW
ncbi:MAG: AMP-binding protein [Mycobacterium sp.]